MPVIVVPSAPPEPIVDATSSDGKLYALVDQVGGGVYLEADFATTRNRADFSTGITPWTGLNATVSHDPADQTLRAQYTSTGSASRGTTWTIPFDDRFESLEWVEITFRIRVASSTASTMRVALGFESGVAFQFKDFAPPIGQWTAVQARIQVPTGERANRVLVYGEAAVGIDFKLDDVAATSFWVQTEIVKARFSRGPDRIPVRSGHDAWAPGAKARAYDLEAPLGAPSAWYVRPVYRDGGIGAESTGVQVVTRTVDRVRDIWLKSIADPLLNMKLRSLGRNVEIGFDGRDAAIEIPGSAYRGGSWDVPIRQPIEINVVTETLTEFQQLRDLISAGPMLIQMLPMFGIDDEYVKLGSMRWSYHVMPIESGSMRRRAVRLTLNPCLRPPTLGAPLYIPGRTWDLLKAAHSSWDVVKSTYTDWDEIARPADAE